MCTNYYVTHNRARLVRFSASLTDDWVSPTGKNHVFNHYPAPIVRADEADKPQLLTAEFGLLPAWSKERKPKFATMNARVERVADAPAYRHAWKHGQKCIIPADVIVEPDWRTGKHIPAKISRIDGEPMGVAGLWDRWRDSISGETVYSFTMLTINADAHPVMNQFHKPQDEKRMVVILPESAYQDWLIAPAAYNRDFLLPFDADKLTVDTGLQDALLL